ncbi:MAG: tRNA (adenosine(37)-N6)-dimethylallyltransferase MiaA [Gammaproteobacteria bacterium]|jgi:tRNA dimethylallyltransferase
MSKNSVICIMGPTASGKSKLAMQLAREINGEIISVDSALVYRGMDIGTAKPAAKELKEIPHHLINIRDPKESYSAAEFCTDARTAIKEILAKNKKPILVGGTMLYFKALQFGLDEMPSADKNIRKKISRDAEKLGWPAMHKKLQQIDPKTAKKINPNDSQRIQRALEVYELTGQPISILQTKNKTSNEFNFINFAIKIKSRCELHQKIAERFKKMLEQGLIEEVRKLFNRGDLNPNLPSMRAVGYRQVWQYLAGEYDYETMIEKAIAATRQLAKRQLTWLKSWPDLHIIANNHSDLIKNIC